VTVAPPTLAAARSLLLANLPGLDPVSVGIVGDAAHRGGYHCGRDRVDADDYSVRESSRDRLGLTEAASALDIGQWSARVGGKSHDLRSMSVWLVAQCKANTPDSRDIREIIYSPDGVTVRRWDRLGKRSSGDSSHRWHTHISYHRDAIKAGRDQSALYRRYLTEIGLVAGEDDDMAGFTDQEKRNLLAAVQRIDWSVGRGTAIMDDPAKMEALTYWAGRMSNLVQEVARRVDISPEEIAAIASAVPAAPTADETAQAVLDALGHDDLDEAATALRAVLGADRATELAGLLLTAPPA
jgi:hypothetical protein